MSKWDEETALAQRLGWSRLPNNVWVKRVGHTTHYNGGLLWQEEVTYPVYGGAI